MAYADLTKDQKEDLAQADNFIRGLLSTIVQSIDLEMDWWTTVIDPIMANVNTGEFIPNSSALAGSQDLTKEDLQAIKSWLDVDIAKKILSNKSLVVKAIGINAE